MEKVNTESYGELLRKNFIAFVQGTACNRDGMFSTKLEPCRVNTVLDILNIHFQCGVIPNSWILWSAEVFVTILPQH